jgi:hypothetical protein
VRDAPDLSVVVGADTEQADATASNAMIAPERTTRIQECDVTTASVSGVAGRL